MTHSTPELTRRGLFGAALGLGALLAVGCSAPGETPAPAAPPTAGFPVTLPHAFGATTLDRAPTRVVLVGFKEQDYFLALGTVPVGIREWFGSKPNAVWPWAQHLLGGAQPTALPRPDIDYEQVALLRPDVIVGLSAGLTQEQYDLLTGIAPTVAQPSAAGDWSISWQEMTRTAGAILGKSADAEKLVGDLEARIAAARRANPAFEGATTVLASTTDGQVYLYGPGATGAQVLASLGMRVPDEITRLTDNPDAYHLLSPERFDLTNVDLAVWSEAVTDDGPKALLANPLYVNQPVHREGRDLFLGLDLYNGALVFSSVLSLPMVLDELVPQFAAALDGNPATRAPLGPPLGPA